MKQLVLLSDFPKEDSLLQKRLKQIFKGKSFKLGYIPSQTDKERKFFPYVQNYFQMTGVKDILYFDVDEEYDESLIPKLQSCDGIFLSGGNTFYFLKNLQTKNLLDTIRLMVEEGKPLLGISAGSIMMSPTIEIATYIDENNVSMTNLEALHLTEFEFMPHWESMIFTLPKLKQYAKQQNKIIYTCSDGDGIVMQGNKLEFYGNIEKIDGEEEAEHE
ncbi:dipeptidase E [Salirhabdus euzebyi]|uniref:Dipeptidase E n=1 Tax=Salirhabdus euzebyi TaxID=394506 RepID=A0A841Q2K7_9BACI|nr:Type 1 glutamine amidotransferase-like domain-containing protein [Salirhabdus euzebyi]MBB6452735.1 dipeptidase E [Salirhabdus euzebyi]